MPNDEAAWGAPMTDRETKLLHMLVASLGGFSVDLVPVENLKTTGKAYAGFSVGSGRSIRLEDIAAIFAPDPHHIRHLAELVDLLVADTLGPSVEDEPDNESVGATSKGPLPMTFGHVRRAQEAIAALGNPEPDPLREAAPDMLAALKGMKEEWDRLTLYGSPMARAANETVQAMDAAIAKAEGRS